MLLPPYHACHYPTGWGIPRFCTFFYFNCRNEGNVYNSFQSVTICRKMSIGWYVFVFVGFKDVMNNLHGFCLRCVYFPDLPLYNLVVNQVKQ